MPTKRPTPAPRRPAMWRRLLRVLPLVAASACAHAAATSTGEPTARRLCAGRECVTLGPLTHEWQEVQRHGTDVGWFNAGVGGVIQADATCRDDAEAGTLEALTEHLLVGYTGTQVRSATTLPFARREARRTVLDAKLDGVPFVLDLLVLKSNGCVFDLSYAAPPDGYARGAPDFQRFLDGFVETHEPSRSPLATQSAAP